MFLKLLLGVAFASALSVAPAQAGQCKGKDEGSPTKPVEATPAQTQHGFRYTEGYYRRRCDSGNLHTYFGAFTADGRKPLVPAKYHRVRVISPTTALVQIDDDAPFRYYRFGKGEAGPAPFADVSALTARGSDVDVAFATSARGAGLRDPGRAMTYYLFDASGSPVELRNLMRLRRYGGVLVADLELEGTPVSRLLDLQGRTVSPFIGRIDAWQTVPAEWNATADDKEPVGLLATIARLDHPDLPFNLLYMPVDDQGRPRAMPEGAIGVIPLPESPHPMTEPKKAFGWAVVYGTPDGFQLAPSFTRLEAALSAKPTVGGLRRAAHLMTSSNRFIEDVYAARSLADGRWRIADRYALKPVAFPGADSGGYGSSDEAYLAYVTAQQARQAGISRAIAEERAAQSARIAVWKQEEWARIQASGKICERAPQVVSLGREALTALLRSCNVSDPGAFAAARREGVDPAVIAAAKGVYDKEQSRVAALLAPPSAPAGGSDPWAAGLAAAQRASAASQNAFVAQQAAVYMRNLNAWNSGAQNWCCAASPPR